MMRARAIVRASYVSRAPMLSAPYGTRAADASRVAQDLTISVLDQNPLSRKRAQAGRRLLA